MKKMFYSYIRVFAPIVFFACCACVLTTGCASTGKTKNTTVVEQTQTKQNVKKVTFADLDRRLINAERKERKLMYELDHAKTTDEIIRCKDKLDTIHAEIVDIMHRKDLQAAPYHEGFKSVKERRYTYGPLGFVFKLTQWILEKLYLIDRS